MGSLLIVAVVATAAVLSGCTGVPQTAARVQEDTQATAIRLSDHVRIIRLVEANDPRGAIRFLTAMADGDVMRLMEAHGGKDVSEIPDFTRKALISYSRFRQANPDLYGVPSYVEAQGRAEYEQNLKRIQRFLDKVEKGTPRP